MLVILYGTTVEMGKKSRQYFLDCGFEYIQKYHYVPDDFALQTRFGKRRESTKEEALNCDFVYENNGMFVGFHKEQIIDAVRGRKKCLLTASSQTLLHTLQFAGYRIWYDEGIQGGENWRKIIASKIQDTKCKDFLLFSSEHSTESRHVKAEINLALNLGKKITTVRLDGATFDMDLEMYLTNDHYLVVRENRTFDEEIVRAMDDTTRIS